MVYIDLLANIFSLFDLFNGKPKKNGFGKNEISVIESNKVFSM